MKLGEESRKEIRVRLCEASALACQLPEAASGAVIDSGLLAQHGSVQSCRESERVVWSNPVGCVVLSCNLCMVTFYFVFLMVLGVLRTLSSDSYGCRPIPGVVGFSFSGLTFCLRLV